MTIQESHRLFKILLDKNGSLNYPNFLKEEIDILLNLGYKRYIKQRYGRNNIKRSGLEEDQKRIEDLKGVLKYKVLIPEFYNASNYDDTTKLITLPEDHWFVINEKCILNNTGCDKLINVKVDDETPTETVNGKYAEVIPVTHLEIDKINTILKNPYRGPSIDKVLRLMYQDKVELFIPENTNIIYYMIRYVKKPISVSYNDNITFETSDHTHDEIIQEAVNIALENIESGRVATYPIINNTKE